MAVLVELKGHGSTVNFAAFSTEGTRVVTASDDRTVRIWDTCHPLRLVSLLCIYLPFRLHAAPSS
jgi:hypothetical protein